MLISRETDYAIRILRALADGQLHVMADMCESESIPPHFGYKIVEKLHGAGMVCSTKGRGGGCRLNVDLHEVSLYDLMKVTSADLYVNDCLVPGHACPWKEGHGQKCHVHDSLSALQTHLDETLQSITLYNLIFEEPGEGEGEGENA